jgi:signal peptidase II
LKKKYAWIAAIVVILLILIDQLIKFWVKTNMTIGETIPLLGQWFNLHFVENEGMAFGISFGKQIGKFLLSLVRILLVGVLCWYFVKRLKENKMDGVVLTIFCLVVAGALGNIIDSMFYGIWFTESDFLEAAKWSPGHGYAPFFFGKVVDMFYFPIIDTTWPQWLPWIGGKPFTFFDPVFNFADSCVTVGAFYLILFQWKFFSSEEKKEK